MRKRDCNGEGGAISYSKSRKKRKANGCMAAFFHLFDFHHFYFSSHHHLTIHSPPSSSKSLKIIEESLPSTTYKDTQSFNIPPVSMRVRTEIGTRSSRLRALASDTSSCNSPSSKTPNLVARLMGLDLLPDKTDINLHTMTHHGTSRLSKKGTRLGTRSLPESPRVSSARKSDFDIHRLSLQLNKENKHQEFGCSRLKQDQEENRSPRESARQIVKKIKERVVTRRVVGMDITKRAAGQSQDSNNELRRDTTVSCSPRSRFSDKENKQTTVLVEKPKQKRVKQRELRPINRCNKAESEPRFTQRLVKPSPLPDIPIKQREAFLSESTDAKANPLHKKKLKKIPNSNDLTNISATKPPKNQKNETEIMKSNENAPFCSTLENSPKVARKCKLVDSEEEEEYITRIINLAGINTESSSTMLLDPSIFPEIEHSGENLLLALRCNRRLLFDLVSEILEKRRNYHGSELIGEVCSDVARYSQIHRDRREKKKEKLEEEGEEIVAEIERDFIDALVREMVSELGKLSY